MLVGTMAALTSCATPPGEALVVNDRSFSEDEFQEALAEIGEHVVPDGAFGADTLATSLMLGVVTDEALEQVGAPPVTDEQATALLLAVVDSTNAQREAAGLDPLPATEEFSPTTLEAVHMDAVSYAASLGEFDGDIDAVNAAINTLAPEADVVVNPRFGEWDPTVGVVDTVYPWLLGATQAGDLDLGGVLAE